jgi:choline dehydrogenase-like flavoprotein
MNKNSIQTIYDCIVVGSGAAGGWAAQELTAQGLNVLVLEAGPNVDPAKDFRSHQWPYESKYRGRVGPREDEFFPSVASEYNPTVSLQISGNIRTSLQRTSRTTGCVRRSSGARRSYGDVAFPGTAT